MSVVTEKVVPEEDQVSASDVKSLKKLEQPKSAYTRRIIKESIAEHLTRLAKDQSLDDIPEFKGYLPSGLSAGTIFDKDNLPKRPKSESQDLPPDTKVCIVGSGMAGLYSALILEHLGIKYDILEANNRPGGRILTHYFSPRKHDYYDIGAMRTFDLWERLKIKKCKYYLKGPKTPKRYNAVTRLPEDSDHEDPFNFLVKNGGAVPAEKMDEVSNLLEDHVAHFKRLIKKDDDHSYQKLVNVDELTVREFLRKKGVDFHTIQCLELTDSATGLFDQAFTETVLDSLAFDYTEGEEKWYSIEGGSSVMTEAFVQKLTTKPEYNKRVTKLAINRTLEGENNMVVVCNYDEPARHYTTVINTTTLACLQRIDTTDVELSVVARDALRALHYDSSTKVAIKFTHAWWITECGVSQGGVANTDLPIRVCVYPSYAVHDDPNQTAVLLCSYTWSQDATRIGSLVNLDSPRGGEELKGLMLYNLARLHTKTEASFQELYKIIKDAYITHHGFDWAMDDYSSGAFALFGPGQFRHLYPHLVRPAADAKLHIVGEAASSNHAWVAGSLESAYRGVWNFLERFKCFDLQKKMEEGFSKIPELETGEDGFAHLLVALGRLPRGMSTLTARKQGEITSTM